MPLDLTKVPAKQPKPRQIKIVIDLRLVALVFAVIGAILLLRVFK